MDIALMQLNTNSSNTKCNSNSNDIENNIKDNTLRINNDNNRTLEEIIKEDRTLVLFLMVLGFYIDDDKNSIGIKILARSWQCCLLLFGGIGFVWTTFIEVCVYKVINDFNKINNTYYSFREATGYLHYTKHYLQHHQQI